LIKISRKISHEREVVPVAIVVVEIKKTTFFISLVMQNRRDGLWIQSAIAPFEASARQQRHGAELPSIEKAGTYRLKRSITQLRFAFSGLGWPSSIQVHDGRETLSILRIQPPGD